MHLLITNAYPGPQALYRNGFIHRRVLAYMAEGTEVTVYYLHPPVTKPYAYKHEGVTVHVGGVAHFSEHLALGLPYQKFLVHFPQQHAVMPLIEQHPDVPTIAWVHGFETEAWHRRWFNFVHTPTGIREAIAKKERYHRGQLEFLAWLFTTTEHQIDVVQVSSWFAEHISHPDVGEVPRREHIIPNYIDEGLYPFKPETREHQSKILSIRPYASWKYANDLSARAITSLSSRPYFDELHFRMIGDGPLYGETTAPLRSFKNVALDQGFLSQPRIAEAHAASGLFLAPTRFDSQGVSMCEAMASGLVPLATDVSAISEFVQHGESGFLARPENPEDLAEYIDLLVHDFALFSELSNNAAQAVRRKCGWESTIARELELIQA